MFLLPLASFISIRSARLTVVIALDLDCFSWRLGDLFARDQMNEARRRDMNSRLVSSYAKPWLQSKCSSDQLQRLVEKYVDVRGRPHVPVQDDGDTSDDDAGNLAHGASIRESLSCQLQDRSTPVQQIQGLIAQGTVKSCGASVHRSGARPPSG